jgi:CarD family transcriptional regulator
MGTGPATGRRRAAGYAIGVNLAVGDVVVYGNHGIGRVVAREPQVVLGEKSEVVKVEMDDGLTVTLPVERAHEQLRAVAGAADVNRVREILREDRAISFDSWLSRRRETLEKLVAGDPVRLAEIVGDGAQRERLRRAKGSNPQLSPGEREIFVKARKLLSGEIALALGLQPEAAEGWIEEQLGRPS